MMIDSEDRPAGDLFNLFCYVSICIYIYIRSKIIKLDIYIYISW